MEKDDESKGNGKSYNYKKRMYDPRIGRFFSVDLLTSIYPMLSSYQFASNRPIDGFDLDGNEWAIKTTEIQNEAGTEITITNEFIVKVKVENKSLIMTAPNDVKAKAELFKQKFEEKYKATYVENSSGIKTVTIYKSTVVLDYTAPSPDDDNTIGHVIFTDLTSTSVTNTTKVKTATGTNTITSTTTTVTAGNTKGEINRFIVEVGVAKDGILVSDSDFIGTILHEIGHSGGLNHPWELDSVEEKLLPELDQNNTSKDKAGKFIRDLNLIIKNLLNSYDNPIKSNRPGTTSNDLLEGQFKVLKKKIEKKAMYDYEELSPTN